MLNRALRSPSLRVPTCRPVLVTLAVLFTLPVLIALPVRADAPAPSSTRFVEDHVTLADLLRWSEAHAPAIQIVVAQRARAAAAQGENVPWLPDNPTLSLSAGPRWLPSIAEGGVDVVVGLSQAIPLTGERDARLGVADADVVVADAAIHEVRWRVHADVHALFHEAVVAGARGRLADEMLAFQDELMKVVNAQIAVGELPSYEAQLAEVDVLTARHDVVAARQASRRVALQLAEVVGWPAGHLPVADDHREHPRQPPSLASLLERAAREQPALQALQHKLTAARAAVVAEDRVGGFVPTIGIQVTQEGNPVSQGGANVIGLATLELPIPSFATNQSARAHARAEVAVAEATLRAAQLQLDSEVARAHSELEAAIARVDTWGTEIVPRSRQHLAILKRAFELGEIDLTALGVGRERLLAAQRAALDAQRDAFVAGADLERVVGVELFDDDGHVTDPAADTHGHSADSEVSR